MRVQVAVERNSGERARYTDNFRLCARGDVLDFLMDLG
jgi:hypothetical protein